jgi:hypothetical protein
VNNLGGAMKQFLPFILALCFIIPSIAPQEKEKISEPIVIKVVNVQLPVRVFFKGQPVDSLKKSDFKIFEGKDRQSINGFYIKRKIITPYFQRNRISQGSPSRYFVLVFQLSDYNQQLQEGLDYLFNFFLTSNDHLLVFINQKSLSYEPLQDKYLALVKITQLLKQQAKEARKHMVTYLKAIENELNGFKEITKWRPASSPSGYKIPLKNCMEKYLSILKEYRTRFLTPDIENYYRLSKLLKGIKKEKWVIHFYQTPLFPTMTTKTRKWIEDSIEALSTSLRAEDKSFYRVMRRLMNRYEMARDVTKEFSGDKISKIFYDVDATFHSVIMPIRKEILSEDLQYESVNTKIHRLLKEICHKTGGDVSLSTDLRSALRKIKDIEDIYYMITYAPKNLQNTAKVKVLTSNKNHQVIYNENIRASAINQNPLKEPQLAPDSSLEIKNTFLKDKKLYLEITGFRTIKTADQYRGSININITIKDINNQVLYNKSNTLSTRKATINLSIAFNWLKKGSYTISVEAKDLLSGDTAHQFLESTIR